MQNTCWAAMASALLILVTSTNARGAAANSLILNEANTVSGGKFLEDDKVDPVLGRLEGNGQNWMEFLVVQGDDLGGGSFASTLDLRGWELEWEYGKDDEPDQHGNGVIKFNDDPLWEAVPQGTLITITEWEEAWYLTQTSPAIDPHGGLKREGGINGLGSQRGDPFDSSIHTSRDLSTDTSWNPIDNDWTINAYAGERREDSSFKYFTFTGTVTEPDDDDPGSDPQVYTIGVDDDAGLFAVNNDDWRITIKDSMGNTILGPIGEHLPPNDFGINSTEILKIEDFPLGSNPTVASYLATTQGSYNDGSSSTFGEANTWSSGGFSEDLSPLREWWDESLIVPGDLNGDGAVTLDDVNAFVLALVNPAMYEMQYPFVIEEEAGDVNGDGSFNLGDVGGFKALVSGASLSSSPESVPEPTTLVLAGMLLCLMSLPIRWIR